MQHRVCQLRRCCRSLFPPRLTTPGAENRNLRGNRPRCTAAAKMYDDSDYSDEIYPTRKIRSPVRRRHSDSGGEYIRHRHSVVRDRSWRRVPVDQNGEKLIIHVDLNTARGLPGFFHAKTMSRQPTSRILELEKELERRYNFEVDRFDILTSRRYLVDGKESAILDYRRSTRVDTTTQFRWMYGKNHAILSLMSV